jgi:predicted protein tyrosine phosphatase
MTARFDVRIGGLHSIGTDIPEFRPTHLLGILDPLYPEPVCYELERSGRTMLLLRFFDIDVAEPEGPAAAHVEHIIAFVDKLRIECGRLRPRLLVHCHAGISRSTASAYIALACDLGLDRADEAFRHLLQVTANPWPNRRLVSLADEALDANGKLLAPLDAYRTANRHRLLAMLGGQGADEDAPTD